MPDVDVAFATISHGVNLHIQTKGTGLEIAIGRDMPAGRMVIESYTSARETFGAFVTDFVREHIYPKIRDHVPSSTRQGRDALYRRLKENEELFRYELSDFGAAESFLADYLAGKAEFEEVFKSARRSGGGHSQEVRRDQVGSVESELPDIINSPDSAPEGNEFEAAPPIMR